MVMKEFTAGERLFAADLNDNFDETQLAENILSGTLDTARIPNLDAAKIASGTLDAARIPIKGIGSNVVQTVKTNDFSTSSTSLTNLTGLEVVITPSSASSRILVLLTIGGTSVNQDGRTKTVTIARNTTSIGTTATEGTGTFSANTYFGPALVALDSPSSTSPVTYRARVSTSGGTATFRRGTITAIEVAG